MPQYLVRFLFRQENHLSWLGLANFFGEAQKASVGMTTTKTNFVGKECIIMIHFHANLQ
jgi:hypothetical protein